ncbi:hypothetical protein ACFL1H_03830 [Nanoarchaeota archaeon]
MKIGMSIIGLLVIIAGVLPLLTGVIALPDFLVGGTIHSGVITLIGVVGLIYGFTSMDLMDFAQKFIMIILALLTIVAGVLPFIYNLLPNSLSFLQYIMAAPYAQIFIIAVGAGTLIYGVTQM